jgi:pimeloyl-ACP methyl ester carboxylesterase
MAALAEQIPDARYIEFDQLGHFGPMQDPALIAELIATFPR